MLGLRYGTYGRCESFSCKDLKGQRTIALHNSATQHVLGKSECLEKILQEFY